MKTTNKGFITIPRSLFALTKWQSERTFTLVEAYIDLQLMAYYGREPTVHKVNNNEVTLSKGQLATTQKYLSDRWRWSTCKVRYALKKLSNAGFIAVNNTPKFTVITVYQAFQAQGNAPSNAHSNAGVFDKYNKSYKEEDSTFLKGQKIFLNDENSFSMQSAHSSGGFGGGRRCGGASGASGAANGGRGGYGTKQDAYGEALEGFAARQAGYFASMDGKEPDF